MSNTTFYYEPAPFRWWGYLLLPLNAVGVLVAAPFILILKLGDG